jgi:cytochrome c oxidase subunit 1
LWEDPPDQPVVVCLRTDMRDVLVTHLLDTEPDHRSVFPEPSIWPLLTAIATSAMFAGSIFTSWAVVYGAIPIFIAMIGWFWPKSPDEGGTQPWPSTHRTLPMPNEAPEGAMP